MDSFFLSTDFDWICFVILAVLTVFLLMPPGEKIVDYCSPRAANGGKVKLTGEKRVKYKRAIILFCGALAVIELLAALLIERWAPFSMLYILLVLADLLLFGNFTRKINRDL